MDKRKRKKKKIVIEVDEDSVADFWASLSLLVSETSPPTDAKQIQRLVSSIAFDNEYYINFFEDKSELKIANPILVCSINNR